MTQDIIIYPTSGTPQVVFTGSGVGANSLAINVLSDSSLQFSGATGQIMKIDNTLGSVSFPGGLSSPETATLNAHIASSTVHYPSSVVTSWVGSNYAPIVHYHDASYINAGTLAYDRLFEGTRYYQTDPMIPDNGTVNVHLGLPSVGQAAIEKSYMENKTQFAPPSIYEYSEDNGATWSAAPFTENDLKELVKGRHTGTYIAMERSWTDFRIGWDASSYPYGYVYLNILYSFFSTNGNYISSIDIDRYDNDLSSLITVTSSTGSWASWPGHLWVPHTNIAFTSSPGSTRSRQARIRFKFNWAHASNKIYFYSFNWHGAYPAAVQDKLFYWDSNKATTFKGDLNTLSAIKLGPEGFGLSARGDSFLGGSFNTSIDWNAETNNTGLGYNTLKYLTSGDQNTAFGSYNQTLLTEGSNNTSLGFYSLYSNVSSSDNTSIGTQALRFSVTGPNTAVGRSSLYNNTSGISNTALGYQSLVTNATGSYNTAVGHGALRLTTGNENTAVGYLALYNATTGVNDAFGRAALYYTTGTGNVGLGRNTLFGNIGGNYNTAAGFQALQNGQPNRSVALGYQAGYDASGDKNIFIGNEAGAAALSFDNTVVIGFNVDASSSNQTILGNDTTSSTIIYGYTQFPDGLNAPQYASSSLSATISSHTSDGSIHYASSVLTNWATYNTYTSILADTVEIFATDSAGQLVLASDDASIAFANYEGYTLDLSVNEAAVNHNLLSNLTVGNPHTQYATLSGATFTGNVLAPSVSATNLSATQINGGDLAVAEYLGIQSGDVLVWNNSTSAWNNSKPYLSSLLYDTTITSPSANQSLVWNGSSWVNEYAEYSELYSSYWDDRFSAATWSYYGTGTGNGRFVSTSNINSTENAQGVVVVHPGTTSTGIGSEYLGLFNITTGSIYEVEMRVAVQTSSAGDTCRIDHGFYNNYAATAAPTYGALIRYDGGNSPYWECVTINGGSPSSTITTVTVNNISPMDTFKIVVNPDASQTVYYINGTLVATHNIVPSGTSALACGTKNTKTLGTNTKYAYMDWIKMNLFRTSDR